MTKKNIKEFVKEQIGYDFKPIPTKYLSRSFKYNPSGFSYAQLFGPTTNSIFMILCYHYNRNTDDCFPSEQTMADEIGVCRNTIREHILPLFKYRLIEKVDPGRGRVNHYKVIPPNNWIETSEIIKELGIQPVHPVNRGCSYGDQVNDDKNIEPVQEMNEGCLPEEQQAVHEVNTNKNLNKNKLIKKESIFPKISEEQRLKNISVLQETISKIKQL